MLKVKGKAGNVKQETGLIACPMGAEEVQLEWLQKEQETLKRLLCFLADKGIKYIPILLLGDYLSVDWQPLMKWAEKKTGKRFKYDTDGEDAQITECPYYGLCVGCDNNASGWAKRGRHCGA